MLRADIVGIRIQVAICELRQDGEIDGRLGGIFMFGNGVAFMRDTDLTAAKTIGDAVSFGVVVGTLLDILPAIAALLTIIWIAIRIYETAALIVAIRCGCARSFAAA